MSVYGSNAHFLLIITVNPALSSYTVKVYLLFFNLVGRGINGTRVDEHLYLLIHSYLRRIVSGAYGGVLTKKC